MKKIMFFGYFCISFLGLAAQDNIKKPSSLALHLFYYDFNTVQQIKATSLGNVLKNGNWSNFRDMQMGIGFNYLKGINRNLDFVATLDGSGVNYLFKDGTTNGSSKFLLDLNVGLNAKLFDDTHAVAPYFFGGTGFSYYKKKYGIYLPVGLGVRFNLFNEAFVTTNLQYRFAGTSFVNNHLYYTVGIGIGIGKKTKSIPIVKEIVPQPVVIAPVEVKVVKKGIRIKVVDEQTGIALGGVTVTMNNDNFKSVSDVNGDVVLKDVIAGNYEIKGILNNISTNTQSVQSSSFNGNEEEIHVMLTHNDPRFTLVGIVEEKSSSKPIAGATVNILNNAKDIKEQMQNDLNGKFNIQLSGESDYVFSAKKHNYMSDINSVSTKGLNRSTTLYVILSLGMEEAKQNSTITLPNIYYQTGSITINPEASSDLDKLVLFLTDNASVTMEIASHTDSRGDAAKNVILSQRRAQEVVNYLKNNGINGNRLIAHGYGETRLLNACKNGVKCSETQHEKNRRTEFKVVSN